MLNEILSTIRSEKPLVHCITNYVTANDCANILLACGASPIMADDPDEAAEITSQCSGLVLNLGTPNQRKLQAMKLAGREANRLSLPIILDPVGVGCSSIRRDAVRLMMNELLFSVIRGNSAEIAALIHETHASRGVDAEPTNESDAVKNARLLAQATGATVIVTGESDIVTDGKKTFRVLNGHPMMRSVTGAGCQLSALLGAFAAANPNRIPEAALAAVCTMGLCGETAHHRLSPLEGNATYRSYIIDAVFNLTSTELEKGARYEIIR